jgi:hypothetical protein
MIRISDEEGPCLKTSGEYPALPGNEHGGLLQGYRIMHLLFSFLA